MWHHVTAHSRYNLLENTKHHGQQPQLQTLKETRHTLCVTTQTKCFGMYSNSPLINTVKSVVDLYQQGENSSKSHWQIKWLPLSLEINTFYSGYRNTPEATSCAATHKFLMCCNNTSQTQPSPWVSEPVRASHISCTALGGGVPLVTSQWHRHFRDVTQGHSASHLCNMVLELFLSQCVPKK